MAPEDENMERETEEENGDGFKFLMGLLGGVFLLGAIGLALYGFFTMYAYTKQYASISIGHIVDGDAYNYTIIAIRGVGWICAGIISAIIGSILVICSSK